MQVYMDPNFAAPKNIVDATVQAFNLQKSVGLHQSILPIEKNRLLANDPLYVDVQPYSIFYRLAVSLAATVNRDETKDLFGLSDAQINAILKRTQTALETNNEKTVAALNLIESATHKNSYKLPVLVQSKTSPETAQSTPIIRPYRPQIALPPAPANLTPTHKSAATGLRSTAAVTPARPAAKDNIFFTLSPSPVVTAEPAIKTTPQAKPKLARDLAKAASAEQKDKPPVQKRKRSQITLPKAVVSLTVPKICEEGSRLHDEMGLGYVSREDFTNRKSVTTHAIQLREFTAYTAYRVLPSNTFNLERIEASTFMLHCPIKTALARIEAKISAQDKVTVSFLRNISDRLGLTEHQKKLLFVPSMPRFKTWGELQDITDPKAPAPLQSPEGP